MTAASGSDSETASVPAEVKAGAEPWNPRVTRQSLLKTGAAVAAAGGAAATLGRTSPAARAASNGGNKYKGAQFRGFVRYDNTAAVLDLELAIWPLPERAILVRVEACQVCYSYARNQIATTQATAAVAGHGGVGYVVAKGSQVRRFDIGDRVITAVTPQCGACYNCLVGRADMCQRLFGDDVNGGRAENLPWMRMPDGRLINGGKGHAELMLVDEEWGVPLFTDADAVELSLFTCVGATGFGMSTTYAPPHTGADVVVFGCGPIGLSAINGAAVSGAGQIIAVDQIDYRRQVALEVGATMAIDPTGKEATLPAELRELCKGPTPDFEKGGRAWGTNYGFGGDATGGGGRGPDFIYEATSAEIANPTQKKQPGPAGISLQHVWQLCPNYGTLVTSGLPGGSITIQGANFAVAGKTLRSAQYGGTNLMRDMPRFVTMLEKGQYRADKIATMTVPLSKTYDAMYACAYRNTVSAHVKFDINLPLGKQ